jgi:ribosomal-protein-alanine N-acetyltransferase
MMKGVPAKPPTLQARGGRVLLRAVAPADATELVALHRASRRLFGTWTPPTLTVVQFRRNYKQWTRPGSLRFMICLEEDGRIVGDIALSQIFLGRLKSAYMGYSIGAPHAGQGYMQEAMQLALRYAFRTLKLNRVEANIQPGNRAFIALAQRMGFSLEGYSRRYLRLANAWRDHQRWALLAQDWKPLRNATRHAAAQSEIGIRDLGIADIAAFAVLRHTIASEGQFTLPEPAAELADRDKVAERIHASLTDPAHKRILAVAGGKLAGFVSGTRGETNRSEHNVQIAIGILQTHTGRGIGRRLMDAIETWARAAGARRLDLCVMIHNERAIALYLSCGFCIEGRTRGEYCIDGKLVDAYIMGKILD